MKNLAGQIDCDAYILDELYLAGIPIIDLQEPREHEVPARLIGEIEKFKFTRAWYYWAVSGPVPLEVAQAMYQHPRGREDVRVAGHCGCPPPEEWQHNGFIDSYHIDSQSGLNYFVDALKARKIIPAFEYSIEEMIGLRKEVYARCRELIKRKD